VRYREIYRELESSIPDMTVVSTVIAQNSLGGHLGHLSPEQETVFEQFKDSCAEQSLSKPVSENDDDAGDGIADDGTLLYAILEQTPD
jgi:hypothetical protein